MPEGRLFPFDRAEIVFVPAHMKARVFWQWQVDFLIIIRNRFDKFHAINFCIKFNYIEIFIAFYIITVSDSLFFVANCPTF